MIRHQKKLLVGLVGLLLGGVAFGPGASDASGRSETQPLKKYTATTSGARVYGGVPVTETISLKNTTANHIDLGAAKVVVPTGLNVTGSPSAQWIASNGTTVKPWNSEYRISYDAPTRTIKVSGMDIDPLESVKISVMVDTCSAGSYAWASDARQSNQFNGTDNKLILQNPNPVTTIAPADACRLAFTGQPTDNFPGGTITQVPYIAAGAPITVVAQNGLGAPLATWASPITIALAGGDAPTTLNNSTVTQTGATATIAPNIGAASVAPYYLTASTTGLASVNSVVFYIDYKAIVHCSGPCQTPEVPGPGGGSASSSTEGDGTVDGEFVLQWDNGGDVPDCPGYTEMDHTVFFNVTSGSSSGMKLVTLKIPTDANHVALADYQVCFRAPYVFSGWTVDNIFDVMTSDTPGATPAPLVGDKYEALLFNCSSAGATPPCIASRTLISGGAQIVLRVPAGDPWAR